MHSMEPFRAGRVPGASPLAALEASGPTVLLADVSEFEPDINDAAYLKWSKAAIIRAAYGAEHDDLAWYGGARRSQLHEGGAQFLGIYQYLAAWQDGGAQARELHRLVGDLLPGEVLIADFEEGSHSLLTAWYNQMLSAYGSAIAPFLWTYTGLDFGQANGALPVQWIAAYQATEPSTPHKLWQFSPTYSVPGVGVADCSVFHGTITDLAALAYQGSAWKYGAPLHLTVKPGHTNFHATWDPPANAPVAPDHYVLSVYEGVTCTPATLVATYPRTERGTFTSPDPGGLKPATEYTMRLAASGPGTSHAGPPTEVQFRTGGSATGQA